MARNRQTSLSHGSFEPLERSVGSGGSIFEALQQPRDPVRRACLMRSRRKACYRYPEPISNRKTVYSMRKPIEQVLMEQSLRTLDNGQFLL